MNDNPDSIEQMYRAEADTLRRFLKRKLSNSSDVEEVLHEAYLRLIRSNAQSPVENIRGFLYKIATNLVIDRYRAARSNVKHLDIDEVVQTPGALISEESSPEEISIVREKLGVTLETIRGLPPRCRQVFVLHRIKQMTHREISKELGISTQMVEKHIAKAVRICTERIMPYE